MGSLHTQIAGEVRRWFGTTHIDHSGIDFEDDQKFRRAVDLFATDYARYEKGLPQIPEIRLRAEMQGILLYRIAREYFVSGDPVCNNYAALGRFLSGFELYYSSEIGEGLKINHGVGTVVGARSIVGKNATLHHGITFGDKDGGRPHIGDHVTVYPGAVIAGAVRIGNNVIVAPNSVCLNNVPDNVTIAGIPARIIKHATS